MNSRRLSRRRRWGCCPGEASSRTSSFPEPTPKNKILLCKKCTYNVCSGKAEVLPGWPWRRTWGRPALRRRGSSRCHLRSSSRPEDWHKLDIFNLSKYHSWECCPCLSEDRGEEGGDQGARVDGEVEDGEERLELALLLGEFELEWKKILNYLNLLDIAWIKYF